MMQVTSAKLDTNIDVAGTLDVTGVLTADSNASVAGDFTTSGHASVGANITAATRALSIAGATSDATSSALVCYNSLLNNQLMSIRNDGYVTGASAGFYPTGGVYLGGSGSANLLDDYEEGSFTPTLEGETPCTITTSTALGQYNKVGRIVNVTMFFQLSAITGGASNLAVSFGNLPFTTNTNLNTTGSVRVQNFGSSVNALQVLVFNNATGGRVEEFNGTAGGNLSDHLASNTNIGISITYSIT
jgi:hypothetical protein